MISRENQSDDCKAKISGAITIIAIIMAAIIMKNTNTALLEKASNTSYPETPKLLT